MTGKSNQRTWVVISIVLTAVVSPAVGRTIYVPADFNNIQAAIDDSNDGDTVIVADGVYTDFYSMGITIHGKSITLRSENGPTSCIIDCNATESNLRRGFSFMSGEDSILDGFTIINGIAPWQQFPPSGDFMSVGGAIFCMDSSPTIRNCIISGNSSMGADGGGIYILRGSPTVTNCTFSGNSASNGGGFYSMHSSPTITNCKFIGNSASTGGGMRTDLCSPTITNCVFIGNSVSDVFAYGGGMYNARSSSIVTGCTFSCNTAYDGGGGICNYYDSTSTLTNCILWDNTASSGSQIYNFGTGSAIVTYSNVQGGWPGLGNIDADPCFVLPGYWDVNGTPGDQGDDFWVNGDYHLKSQAGRWDPNSQSWVMDYVSSPCIDAGNPGCPLGDEPDPNGNRINMGAYGGTAEASKSPAYWRSIADMTNDWIVDSNDLKSFVGYWLQTGECIPSDFDRNQFVDSNDLAIFGGQWQQKGPGPGITYDIGACIPVDFPSSAVVESEPTRFTVTVEGQYILFEDMMRANCCPEELDVQMTVEDDLITIYEIESFFTRVPCPCMCDFPITATFGPFEPGTYILEVYQDDSFIGTTTVTISSDE